MQYKHRLTILFPLLFVFIALAWGLNVRHSLTAVSTTIPQVSASPTALISFDANAATEQIDTRLLGTNLPAWLGTSRTENGTFIGRTQAAAPTLIRIPGGSWSNGYDWLACETSVDIEGAATCGSWDWGLSPTEFINFLQVTGAEGMYTINQNGTSQEAAALVAFFNGDVNDTTPIGNDVDVRGRDWLTVGDWAQLRSDNGNPDPINIRYWEIGNEIYGGTPAAGGADCAPWGWEDVWTCDGTEYVNGIGSGVNRKEGYLEFRDAMQRVDASIMVGAVSVPSLTEWNGWANEVITAAGDVMDFYIIHQYSYFTAPNSREEALTQPQDVWQPMMDAYKTAYEQAFPGGTPPPVAVTEHNLFSVHDQDNGRWMTQAVNMLFMADSIGQMMENGFAMANQWDLANGRPANGTDYGMLDDTTYARSPQYYVFPMWTRFGDQLLPLTSSYNSATTLSAYAGRIDPSTLSLLVINKTGGQINAPIQIDNFPPMTYGGEVDVVQASSLDSETVIFNGVSNPSDDLSSAPPKSLAVFINGGAYAFPPYSITLLRIGSTEFIPTDFVYLPIILR